MQTRINGTTTRTGSEQTTEEIHTVTDLQIKVYLQHGLMKILLTYITKVGKNNFTLMAGTGLVRHRKDQSFYVSYDFPEDLRVKTMNAANVISNASTYVDEWSLASFFGRVMYDYEVSFTASLRDGSSKLFKKWTTIPSFFSGLAEISKSFMSIDVIGDQTILNWGVGNQDGLPGNYLALV